MNEGSREMSQLISLLPFLVCRFFFSDRRLPHQVLNRAQPNEQAGDSSSRESSGKH